MTQEQKDLLLKDLCARLPYNPMVEYKGEAYNVLGITCERLILCKPFMSCALNEYPLVEEVKPYLFPMSSMTEEQREKYESLCETSYSRHYECGPIAYNTKFHDTVESIDYLIENHFDYRGLIPKGLAEDATGLNIY